MLQYDLSAQERGSFGKGASKSLRKAGKTPAIMYGSKTEPLALSIDSKELMKVLLDLQRRNAVFNIDVESDGATSKRHVILKEVQTEPIKDTLVHADFCEVSLDKPIVLQVPVKYTGIAKGVELGGELVVNLATVTVQGLVLDIPDYLEVDVTELIMSESVTCADLTVAGNVELLNGKDEVCASIQVAKVIVEEEEEEAEVSEESAEGAEGAEETAAE